MRANSFKDLEVYKLARQLSLEILEETKSFSKEEMYSLTDQIWRSSCSVGAQMAETWLNRYFSVGKMLNSMTTIH